MTLTATQWANLVEALSGGQEPASLSDTAERMATGAAVMRQVRATIGEAIERGHRPSWPRADPLHQFLPLEDILVAQTHTASGAACLRSTRISRYIHR